MKTDPRRKTRAGRIPRRTKPDSLPIVARVPVELLQRVEDKLNVSGRTLSDLIRQLLTDWATSTGP